MSTYTHDGKVFDLDAFDWADAIGVVWSWTGKQSPAGEPMLRGGDIASDLPLPEVEHYHGPLIRVAKKAPRVRQGPSAGFLASLAAGLVESDEQFAARIGGVS